MTKEISASTHSDCDKDLACVFGGIFTRNLLMLHSLTLIKLGTNISCIYDNPSTFHDQLSLLPGMHR